MSSLRVRNLLTGMALVAALTVALPGSTEAAGRGSVVQDGGVWSLVVDWFSDLWGGAFREPVGGTSGFSNLESASSTTAPPAPATAGVCNGDQGVCIDPNG